MSALGHEDRARHYGRDLFEVRSARRSGYAGENPNFPLPLREPAGGGVQRSNYAAAGTIRQGCTSTVTCDSPGRSASRAL